MTDETEFDEAAATVARLTTKILKSRGVQCLEDATALAARLESGPLAAVAKNAATANRLLVQQATAYLADQDRKADQVRLAAAAETLEQEQPPEE